MSSSLQSPLNELKGKGSGDRFEALTEYVLNGRGLLTLEDHARGPDGGRDLIMGEHLTTALGLEIDYRWLVSCKYRSDGKAIAATDEPMVIERLQRHNCNGFIGFYSTIASADLDAYIRSLQKTQVAQVHMFYAKVYDGDAIMTMINKDKKAYASVLQTYMPTYYGTLVKEAGNDPFKAGDK